MSVIDIIAVIILFLFCIPFIVFIIAGIILKEKFYKTIDDFFNKKEDNNKRGEDK